MRAATVQETEDMWKRVVVLWRLVRGDARRLWFALRHPAAPAWLKVGTALLVLYLLSPVDLLPDTIPLLGVVDDLIIIPFAIRWLLSRLPAHIREEAERRVRG
jgi:uncharacterized membrane protein YkvA (DUF1232 family)